MATRTTYLNLIKPDYSDAADITDINANMDTIDDKIKGIDSAAIDDTLVPTSDSGTIRNQLSQLANRIKAATGAGGWKDDPSTTLASLATLVSNLASGSDVIRNGKKFANVKLGISGLMDTNGYVSFGPNFGGLIVQWGHGYHGDVYYPIAFNSLIPRILTQHEGKDFYQAKPSNVSLTQFTLTVIGDGTAKDADWYAVGV